MWLTTVNSKWVDLWSLNEMNVYNKKYVHNKYVQ